METVDLSKAAGFQAVDSEGNVLGTVSMDQLTDSIASKLATELSTQNSATPVMRTMSAATTMAAAASTGSDKMENAFTETTDPAYVRVIDKNGNSAKQGIASLASVVGGLLVNQGFQSKVGGITYKGEITSFDARLEQGLYWCKGGSETTGDIFTEATNGAPIGVYRWGSVLVIKGYGNSVTQIYLPVSYGYISAKICWRTSPESNENNLGRWSIVDGTII